MKRSFLLISRDGRITPVEDFNGVVKALSVMDGAHQKYETQLKLFLLQSWRPGRWMQYPDGLVVCVEREIK